MWMLIFLYFILYLKWSFMLFKALEVQLAVTWQNIKGTFTSLTRDYYYYEDQHVSRLKLGPTYLYIINFPAIDFKNGSLLKHTHWHQR